MNTCGLFPRLAKKQWKHFGECSFPDCRACDITEHLYMMRDELRELGMPETMLIKDVIDVLAHGYFTPWEL